MRMADAADWPKTATERALLAMLGSIRAALKRGDAVTLVGFGTFTVARRRPRIVRNPRTGQSVSIAGRVPGPVAEYITKHGLYKPGMPQS